MTTDEELEQWQRQGLKRLLDALADRPRIEAELTVMELTVMREQGEGGAVAYIPYNGKVN